MKYKGSCHCGKIGFEVDGELKGAMACNCSICLGKGSLLWFAPRDQMKLVAQAADVATYKLNKHMIARQFCRVCGMHPYGEGVDPKGNRMTAINLRCPAGIDLAAVPVQRFDGRAM